MRLSVLLPTVRPWPEIREALDSCLEQKLAEPFEILVLDGDGCGLDADLAEGMPPPVRWLRLVGADVFELRALGAREARGEILLFGEDHCVAPPTWFAAVSAAHRASAASALVGPVSNHPGSSARAVDRANFALTMGAFAAPLTQLPEHRLPVPTNLSLKRSAVVGREEQTKRSGWLEYELLGELQRAKDIGIAPQTTVAHLQSWTMGGALRVHFQSGRSYGASTRGWPRDQRRHWWRHLPGVPRRLHELNAPAMVRGAAGAPPTPADGFWLRTLIAANVAGQITGALAGPGKSRRALV